MRQQSLKLLSLLFVLFALLAATTSPVAQADVEGAKSTPPTSDEVATLTLDPALLAGLENSAPLAPMTPLGVSTFDETEPNGTPATANTIAGDSAVVEGNIFPNADVDYYAFTAQAGDKLYAAVMSSFSASGNNDSQLRLFNTDGTTLIEFDEDDGSLGTLSSTLAGATLPVAGTYYLEVRIILMRHRLNCGRITSTSACNGAHPRPRWKPTTPPPRPIPCLSMAGFRGHATPLWPPNKIGTASRPMRAIPSS